MSVVFFFRYPVDPSAWVRDHYVTTASLGAAMLAGRTILEKYSWEGQRALAEERDAPWRSALEKIGVTVAVDLYTGSLSSVMENYRSGEEISFVMQAENDPPRMGFFHRAIAFFGLFSFRPIFFLRSNH